MKRFGRKRVILATAALLLALPAAPSGAHSVIPETGDHGLVDQQLTRNIVPEPGFFIHPWAVVPAPTNLDWGPDRLFATSADGNVYSFREAPLDGYKWLGAADTKIFASGLTQPLGLEITADGKQVFVSDSHPDAAGVTVGRVQVFADSNLDGVADGPGAVVVDNLPQGRHNTNDLEISPADGLLYFVNGNQTDQGEGDCGAAPAICESQYSGVLFRTPVTSRGLMPADLEVVARRMRNIYDVAFWPGDPTQAFVPMNGSDDPATDDLLFRFDTANTTAPTTVSAPAVKKSGKTVTGGKAGTITTTTPGTAIVEDAGFPVCVYNPHPNPTVPEVDASDPAALAERVTGGSHSHHGESLEPVDSPVYEPHGVLCPKSEVTKPIATFGGHVSADGLDFARGGAFSCANADCTYANDLYVAEWGDLWGGTGHKVGHKVVRVDMRDDGTLVKDHHGKPIVKDFVTGGLPIDVSFRPGDGSMYVADMGGFIYKVFRHTATETGPTDPADETAHEHGEGMTEHVLFDGGAALGSYFDGQRFTIREYDSDGDGEPDHMALGYDGPGEMAHHHGHGVCTDNSPEEDAYAEALLAASKEASRQYDGWAGFALARRHNFWPYPVTESKLVHMTGVTRGSNGGAADPYSGLWDPFNPKPDDRPANIAPPFDELSEGYYYENRPHVLNPYRMESFVYGMVDDWDGDPSNGEEPGPKVINAMFTFPYLTDAAGDVIPPPNPTGCKMMWHNHSGVEGAATSFDPDNPDQSAWMAHVYVIDGVDPWVGPTTPGEPHQWWTPTRTIPATCGFDSGCIP